MGHWVRVYTEITRDRKLRRHPVAVRWIWLSILCIAKESPISGTLLLSMDCPVTPEDIADEAGVSLPEVEDALKIFENQGMMENENGVWRVLKWHDRQYESDNSTDRVKKHRNKSTNETFRKRFNPVTETPPETETETETETELILSSPNGDSSPELFDGDDLGDEGGEERTAKTQVPYMQIVDLYHECCPSLAKVRQLTKKRRQLIKARWPGSIEPFRLVFSRAEQSDFLTGRKPSRDHPSWVADLEFILREESWAKIIEGKYDNRGSPLNVPPAYQSIYDAVQRRDERDLRRNGGNRNAGIRSLPGTGQPAQREPCANR